MTEPTDAELLAEWDRVSHIADAGQRRLACLRAVLAKWGTPQQEAQKPCQTCAALARTVMCDQVSFDRKPDCYGIRQVTDDEGIEEWEDIRTSPDVAREEANDMMATGRGEIYEVVPLWTTPQPSPTPQADGAQDEPLQAFDSPRAKALMRAWEEGWAACRDAEYVGEEAQNDAFNSSHTLTLCIAEDQQLPAPQADSQPAPQGETNAQLDTDSNPPTPGQQRDVAGPVALGQPVGNGSDQAAGHTGAQGDKLLIVAERNIRSFLRSAVFKSESDREAALNCVDVLTTPAPAQPIDMVLHCPKCGLQHIDAPDDRTPDWKNEPHRSHLCHNPACGHIWRPADVPTNDVAAVKTTGKADSPIAARAPADSVTAPAAFQRALDIRTAQGWKLGGDKVPVLYTDTINGKQVCRDDLWLCTTAAFATQPAQAAHSVLEDAARLDWLALAGPVSICVVIDRPHDGEVEVATDDVTGYGKTLREALDAARKQGGQP